MSEKTSSSSSGIGFVGLLTIVFITLKLCHVIDWSWWWVWSPIWIMAIGLFALITVIALLHVLTRPKTPEQKLAASFRELSKRYKQ